MVTNCSKHRGEVGISGNEDETVGSSLVCIAKHCIGNVYVRHLLRDADHLDAPVASPLVARHTRFTGWGEKFALFTVSSFDDFDAGTVGERVKIPALPLGVNVVGGFVDDA